MPSPCPPPRPRQPSVSQVCAAVSLLVVALGASLACGGPIPSAESPTAAGQGADAGVVVDAPLAALAPIHTMTVSLCARDAKGCDPVGGPASAGPGGVTPAYRVSFGTGTGTLRTRDQAMSDLYREIRDRTSFGTRLAASSQHLERPRVDGAMPEPVPPVRSTAAGHDPVVDAAFDLMEAVDAEGRLTLDVAHGATACKVSLAPFDVDAGRGRCLLQGPARAGLHDSEGLREPGRKL